MDTQAYQSYIASRDHAHQRRTLRDTRILPEGRAERNGKTYLNFASNDYLGLSQHPALIARAREYAERYGAGATASRLITGNASFYDIIEAQLAQGKGCETALIFSSGYQANLTALAAFADPAVAGKAVTILADRLCHHSLLQGTILSGARLVRFRHNDMDHLAALLDRHEKDHLIIVTESVFGMDGDGADLAALTALAEKAGAMLYVDEAHATGVFGDNGFGLATEHKGKIDVAMGTFGKALGSFGAYIACSRVLRDYLVQRCGGLIYSTALPPSVLGSIEAALELLPTLENERRHLQTLASRLRTNLRQQGWDCGQSTTHIIPVILGNENAATDLAKNLVAQGLLAPAIRPPTVPRGTSRLRLSLSAAHEEKDVDWLIEVMKKQA